MKTFRMSLSRRVLLSLPLLATLPARAQTEADPTKPIRIIVPFAPGGSGDITARLVGKTIEDKTGQPFVVENKPGANGIVGVLAVKAAAADGYTLMLATTSTNAANIHMFKSPGYDPEKDFTVVGVIGSSGAFLAGAGRQPVQDAGRPSGLRQGQPGQAQFRRIQCEPCRCPPRCWPRRRKSNGRASPTRRSAMPGATSMPAPSSSCSSISPPGAARWWRTRRGHWRSPCPARSLLYPELPTLSETFPGFTSTGFLAIAVPKATPRPIQERLNALINAAITSPAAAVRSPSRRPLTLEQCAAQDREERAKWAEVREDRPHRSAVTGPAETAQTGFRSFRY